MANEQDPPENPNTVADWTTPSPAAGTEAGAGAGEPSAGDPGSAGSGGDGTGGGSAGGNPPPPGGVDDEPFTPATVGQKIFLSISLWIATITVCSVWFWTLHQIDKQLHTEHTVFWNAPTNMFIKSGPPTFRYDRGSNLLYFRGEVDASTKQELMSLLIVDGTTHPVGFDQAYADAIGRLAYLASDGGGQALRYLLLLGGFSSTLGVLLRLIVNFINVNCYKKRLDLDLFWPYFVMRPITGFLVGFALVLLIKANVLFKGEAAATGSLWWAGVALIAGFGAAEFTDRLRLLTQTMFGESKSKNPPAKK